MDNVEVADNVEVEVDVEEVGRWGKRSKWICVGLMSVIIVSLSITVIILVTKPKPKPPQPLQFKIEEVKLDTFSYQERLLVLNLQVSLRIINPDKKVQMSFGSLEIGGYYRHYKVSAMTPIPCTYLKPKEETLWTPFINGSQSLTPYLGALLNQDIIAQRVSLEVKVTGCFTWGSDSKLHEIEAICAVGVGGGALFRSVGNYKCPVSSH